MTAPTMPAVSPDLSGPGMRIPLGRSLVVVALVGLTLWACFQRGDMNQMSEPGVVMNLPVKVGDFTGKSQPMSEAERTILPKDTELVRRYYTDSGGDEISQTIVLSGGEKRSIHRPEICLPGQGWTITGQEVIPIRLKSGHVMDVVNLTISRESPTASGEKRTVHGYFIYWFVGKDRTTASQTTRILSSAWDRLVNKINHRWAYVIVSGMVTADLKPGGKDMPQTLAMAEDFIRESVGSFQKAEMPSAGSKP